MGQVFTFKQFEITIWRLWDLKLKLKFCADFINTDFKLKFESGVPNPMAKRQISGRTYVRSVFRKETV